MAQSEKLKQMHAEQVAAAQKMFKAYKTFIAEEFILAFGGSYETTYNLPQDWRTYYAYKPECEEFLIDKTKTFIHAYPSTGRIYQSPVFLKNLTSLISEYLSVYVAKKGWDRNTCTKYLKEILFNKNPHVQLETRRYTKENERAFGLQQKKRREQESKRKRPRISNTVIQQEELQKSKKVKKPFLTPEEEAKAVKKMAQIHKIIKHNIDINVTISLGKDCR